MDGAHHGSRFTRSLDKHRLSHTEHRRMFKCTKAVVTCCALLSPVFLSAQSLQQVADSSPFQPLVLPASNEYRSGSGRPGPKYWQQRVDYKINAILDSAKNEIRGRETIHYVNHSPDTLPYLWMFVEQNLCAPNSITNQLNQPPLVFLDVSFDFSCQRFNGGVTLRSFRGSGADANRPLFSTPMRGDPAQPLRPPGALH